MEDMGKYILDKLEKMDDKIDDIRTQGAETRVKLDQHDARTKETAKKLEHVDEKLGEYNEQLKIHIRGVENLGNRQDDLWNKVEPVVKEHETKTAVKTYVSEKWALRIKRATYLSIVAATVVSLLKAYKMI